MRKKTMVVGGIVIITAALVVAYIVVLQPGPDLAAYEYLRQPRITTMPNQKMLVITAQGDPNVVGSKAFGLLFKTYFTIPGVSRNMKQTPRVRWAGDMKMKSSWTGYYALPIPDQTVSLPVLDAVPGVSVELTMWEYGDVAEILHVGPYAEETPTIEKLHSFIKQQGLEIVGYHEEEYLKGPGMFFKGDPAKYYTIIRLRVAKKT